jgi:hypothetical protein
MTKLDLTILRYEYVIKANRSVIKLVFFQKFESQDTTTDNTPDLMLLKKVILLVNS